MTFNEIVSNLERTLDVWISKRKGDGQDVDSWLQTLYTAYSERMRSDNERIWSTGAILLPLSISAFAALVSIENPKLWHTLVLAFGSLVLIYAWLFIAENHRAFQQKSEAWLKAIQNRIGINDTTPRKASENWLNDLLTFGGAIQRMRWCITLAVTLAWFILVFRQWCAIA